MAVTALTYSSSHRASSIAMIVLGVLAIVLPLIFGVAIAILLGIVVIFAGVAFLAYGMAGRGAGHVWWRVLAGIVYIIGGVFLVLHPGFSLISLTLLLAIVFFVEGIFELATYFTLRALSGAGWLLLDALVALFLSVLIWRNWPFSSAWLVGTLVGINLIVNGVAGLSHAAAHRRLVEVL